ncbi:phospholipase D-like domain-containing protein [Alkalihalobacillus pseudalcaliphilus]|uniref:phospholipase D-like domain-containing protein n=1 Tax=Alkalihalobacillus pseudalcaliphilus TaxID=79884 RepID=UPI00064DBF80|nr:phospholipase D-like domain-containing protein [Alkalihalobacillus pseudalcaliphilus]KMK78317.1 phospholipase [Alkalihalobacillus pseudalcaliphilus]
MVRKIGKITGFTILIYVLYVIVTAFLLFTFSSPLEGDLTVEVVERQDLSTNDRVVLVQDRVESGLARIQLIQQADKSIDVSSYAIQKGEYADMFVGALFEAADRGVQVRIILDGIVNQFNRDFNQVSYAMEEHPNMAIKFYEPLNIWMPWTWNNRYHDKLLIIDGEMVMLGGRNIGDRYFSPEGTAKATNDRDVIVIHSNQEVEAKSVLTDISNYYQKTWDHEFTKPAVKNVTSRNREKGQLREKQVRKIYQQAVAQDQKLQEKVDWLANSYPANSITFLHNPLERWNKQPLIWQALIKQLDQASGIVYMESPYIIPTNKMLSYLDEYNIEVDKMRLMTNSFASTPNSVAFSGYYPNRREIAAYSESLYEYQSNKESLHGKTYIFDEQISMVGSFNLDSRSAFLNTEVMLLIDSEPFAKHLQAEIDKAMEHKSLLVLADGSYQADSEVKEAEVSKWKEFKIKALSYVSRLFAHLL